MIQRSPNGGLASEIAEHETMNLQHLNSVAVGDFTQPDSSGLVHLTAGGDGLERLEIT